MKNLFAYLVFVLVSSRSTVFGDQSERNCSMCDDVRMNETQARFAALEEEIRSIKLNQESMKNVIERIESVVGNVKSQGVDCLKRYKDGNKQSGVYTIDPADGLGKMEVYCDMATDGGGWTVFQRRQDGSVDFYRGWDDYKRGFGSFSTEFWLGNDNIHRLTQQAVYMYELRVDLEDYQGNTAHATYRPFSIASEANNYTLSVGAYLGDAAAGDDLTYHNGYAFTTPDRDNDASARHCSIAFKGAWWYRDCHFSNLNGQYFNKGWGEGVNWRHFKGYAYSLKRTSMKIRPVDF